MNNRHIALWSCPRSRSTALSRAFEQRQDCIIYDEPLWAPYLVNKGQYDYHPPLNLEEILKYTPQTDYQQIIQKITGELPAGISFSFQKNISKYMIPEFDRSWLKLVKNFFIIREPKAIISSYWRANDCKFVPTMEQIGLESHYNFFKEIEALIGETPLVINTDDLVKHPQAYLKLVCNKLEIPFSDTMLSWEANPKETRLTWTKDTPGSKWYADALGSSGFTYKERKIDLPSEFTPLIEACLSYHEKLLKYCVTVD
ncbi:MAG: hypothetical protein AAF915_27380 [Cyanobacteria bacterium P01_D01_bin.50]